MSTGRTIIPKPTAKNPLTRERIVKIAVALADKQGLPALSMRSLASRLKVGVMSLYNHISDKDDLLAAMVEQVASDIQIPGPGTPWKESMRTCIVSAYRMLLQHRWLPGLWSQSHGYAKNRYHDALLRVMHDAGFPEALACRGFHALTMHVVGFSLQVLEMPFTTKEEFRVFAAQHLAELEEQGLPYLQAHVRFHLAGNDQQSDFKYMLDLILDGLERDLG